MTPLKSIRAKCLECCADSAHEVKLCPAQDCPLWEYRFGHNPARAGVGRADFNAKSPNSTTTFEGERETEGA